MSNKPSLFAELKRRHVVRVGLAYVVVSWLLLQLGAIIFPTLHAPGWCEAVLLAFLVLGFPVALLLAWAFEVTPEGVRRTESAESEAVRPAGYRRRVGRMLNTGIIVVLAAAVGVLLWQRFGTSPKTQAAHGAVAATAGAAAPATGTAIPAKSIAVLPFADNSSQANQRYFSDGLSESLIIALSQYPALTVIGRESSFQMRDAKLDSMQIGRKLRVANLLEGSVSREGDEVRIRAELVSTANGRTLWSKQYDRPYKNLFALQDAITKAVADALKAKLLGNVQSGAVVQTDRPPSGSLAAYNAYLEGAFYSSQYTRTGFSKAIAAYQAAVKADPNYATAYAGLSAAWTWLGTGYLSGPALTQAYARARSAADTAIKLDSDSAAGYIARGFVQYNQFDWRAAETSVRHAATLAPGNPNAKSVLAYLLAALGHLDEAIRLEHEAIKTNPLNAKYYFNLAKFQAAGDLEAATQSIERATALKPSSSHYQSELAVIQVLRGNARAAIAAAQAASEPLYKATALALAYRAAGDKARAQKELQTLIDQSADIVAYQIAETYAYFGQPDEAFAWLDRAWRQRDPGIVLLLFDPLFKPYRKDPRFAAFCRKVGLPAPGSAS